MDFEKDYYSVLGIDKKAKKEDITSAYRKLMMKWHPDRFASKSKSEQEEATRKSAEINEAYDILSNEEKRKEYDFMRENGGRRHPHGFGGMGGFNFGGFNPWGGFGGMGGFDEEPGFSRFHRQKVERTPQKGRQIGIQVELPFEDFFFGCKKTLDIKVNAKCSHCNGGIIGEKAEYEPCGYCNGQGMTIRRGNGMVIQETCQNCGGTGEVVKNACQHCHGTSIDGLRIQTVEFIIPKDTRRSYSQSYRGVGHAGVYGGENGDIIISARMGDSGMFFDRGDNCLGTIHFVNVFKAISGGYETILTPYGKKTVMIPSEMPDGYEIKFNGMGLKPKSSDESDGNLVVTFKYDLPKGLSQSILKEVSKISDKLEKNSDGFANVSSERKYMETYIEKLSNGNG